MNKFCCCVEPETPDISLTLTCACCEGHIEERKGKDSPDLTVTVEEEGKEQQPIEGEEEDVVCCCFRRKRHANVNKKKSHQRDGAKA